MTNLCYLFPGQGAQYVGMGKSFYEEYPIAKQTFEEADDILKAPLTSLIFDGDLAKLTQTRNSQPAIFVVSLAILRTLESIFSLPLPDFTAGLSLGEYTALVAARKISFKDGLLLVAKRGELMHQACETTKGTMAVVLGLDDESVISTLESMKIPQEIFCANFNCPGQVVISGTLSALEKAKELLLAKGAKRVLPLTVHGAFHSGLMEPAKTALSPYIINTAFTDSPTRVAMNVTGEFGASLEHIKQLLIEQVTASTKWSYSIKTLDKERPSAFWEIGCGKTLTGLNSKIAPITPTFSIDSTKDLPTIEQHLKNLKK